MRIHNEHPESFLHALTVSLARDPSSLECWRILHIEHNAALSETDRAAILQQLQTAYQEMHCDVVPTAGKDIFLITNRAHHDQLHGIAHAFIEAATIREGCVAEYALYDLFRDWKYVQELLTARRAEPQAVLFDNAAHRFGEIASLKEVFAEAKKRRKARMPLHVMLVEDDALTRRIVSGAFQEQYALITAANAQEAVANYLLHAPDIVFLDIGLPDASGFDVLQQIMASDDDAYVVMFSASGDLGNVVAALSQGASGFVGKPFKKERMRHYIEDSALHHHKHWMS